MFLLIIPIVLLYTVHLLPFSFFDFLCNNDHMDTRTYDICELLFYFKEPFSDSFEGTFSGAIGPVIIYISTIPLILLILIYVYDLVMGLLKKSDKDGYITF